MGIMLFYVHHTLYLSVLGTVHQTHAYVAFALLSLIMVEMNIGHMTCVHCNMNAH